MSGTANNIKIICSNRFSLLITIDRFYKLFLAEGAFVNRRPETISPPLFHTAIPIQPPPLRGTSFHRKEGASTRAPSLGRGCRAQRSGVGFLFLGGKSASSLPSPRVEGFAGETVFTFLHPSHAKTTVSYERSFLCVLLA